MHFGSGLGNLTLTCYIVTDDPSKTLYNSIRIHFCRAFSSNGVFQLFEHLRNRTKNDLFISQYGHRCSFRNDKLTVVVIQLETEIFIKVRDLTLTLS